MRGKTRTVAVATVSAAALLAAGCSSGGSGTSGGGDGSGGAGTQAAGGGEISVHGCEPQNAFIPSMTNETCGGNILDPMMAKLVHYNPDTAAPENDIAESIETSDNQSFTVKIKKGYKFHDGTEVKAKNFIDAWNWNRAGKNATLNAYFFDVIEGAADMDCGMKTEKNKETGENEEVPDCEGKPAKADTMSGLKQVDDYTFTIKTSEKVSNLPVRLGYTAFAPLPDSFFTDSDAYGKKPIGAGPFMLESYKEGTEAVLTKFKDYSGDYGPKVDKVTFRIYQDTDSAYKDLLAGQLDLLEEIPTSALADDIYKQDLPDRNLIKPVGVFQSISFPSPKADKSYENKDLRHAISMSIDRETIIKNVFNGTRVPATGWVVPSVDGYKEGACGEYCTFDAAKAKQLFDKAGGYKGKITLSYNADAAHKAWTEATCNSIKKSLGVDCVATGVPTFAAFRQTITEKKMKGLFRTGWQMDYPSIENFLGPIYGTGAGSNDSDYSNPKFDNLLKEAAAAEGAEANTKYQEAEAILMEDMPVIPLWYQAQAVGWSDKVDNVKLTPFGTFDLSSVTVK